MLTFDKFFGFYSIWLLLKFFFHSNFIQNIRIMMLWQERRWKKRLKMNFFNEERKTKWKFSFRKCSIITRKIWNFLFGSVESKMMKKWNKKNRNSLEGFFLPERKKILNPKSSFGFFLVESPFFWKINQKRIFCVQPISILWLWICRRRHCHLLDVFSPMIFLHHHLN